MNNEHCSLNRFVCTNVTSEIGMRVIFFYRVGNDYTICCTFPNEFMKSRNMFTGYATCFCSQRLKLHSINFVAKPYRLLARDRVMNLFDKKKKTSLKTTHTLAFNQFFIEHP